MCSCETNFRYVIQQLVIHPTIIQEGEQGKLSPGSCVLKAIPTWAFTCKESRCQCQPKLHFVPKFLHHEKDHFTSTISSWAFLPWGKWSETSPIESKPHNPSSWHFSHEACGHFCSQIGALQEPLFPLALKNHCPICMATADYQLSGKVGLDQRRSGFRRPSRSFTFRYGSRWFLWMLKWAHSQIVELIETREDAGIHENAW